MWRAFDPIRSTASIAMALIGASVTVLAAALPHVAMRGQASDTRWTISLLVVVVGLMGTTPFLLDLDFPSPTVAYGDTTGVRSTPFGRAAPPPKTAVVVPPPDAAPQPAAPRGAAADAPPDQEPDPEIGSQLGVEVAGRTLSDIEGERKYFARGVGDFSPGGTVDRGEGGLTARPERAAAGRADRAAAAARAGEAFAAARGHHGDGRLREALERYRAARADYIRAGDAMGVANSWQGEGESLRALGDADGAARAHATALNDYGVLGVDIGRANALLGLGFAVQRIDPNRAADRFRAAAALYAAAGLDDWAARARRARETLAQTARIDGGD